MISPFFTTQYLFTLELGKGKVMLYLSQRQGLGMAKMRAYFGFNLDEGKI